VKRVMEGMLEEGVQDVVLECETDNVAAIRLYEKLGFIRDKRLQRCAYSRPR
jgi:N-alpha-acetyltransferase 30